MNKLIDKKFILDIMKIGGDYEEFSLSIEGDKLSLKVVRGQKKEANSYSPANPYISNNDVEEGQKEIDDKISSLFEKKEEELRAERKIREESSLILNDPDAWAEKMNNGDFD